MSRSAVVGFRVQELYVFVQKSMLAYTSRLRNWSGGRNKCLDLDRLVLLLYDVWSIPPFFSIAAEAS